MTSFTFIHTYQPFLLLPLLVSVKDVFCDCMYTGLKVQSKIMQIGDSLIKSPRALKYEIQWKLVMKRSI